jgi:hypothetical protein
MTQTRTKSTSLLNSLVHIGTFTNICIWLTNVSSVHVLPASIAARGIWFTRIFLHQQPTDDAAILFLQINKRSYHFHAVNDWKYFSRVVRKSFKPRNEMRTKHLHLYLLLNYQLRVYRKRLLCLMMMLGSVFRWAFRYSFLILIRCDALKARVSQRSVKRASIKVRKW